MLASTTCDAEEPIRYAPIEHVHTEPMVQEGACARVRACVRACVRALMCAHVRALVRVCVRMFCVLCVHGMCYWRMRGKGAESVHRSPQNVLQLEDGSAQHLQ